MKKEYLECAEVCTAHGVRGQLKVRHLCDSADVLLGQKRIFTKERDGSYAERRVLSATAMGEFLLLSLSGIDSREAAIVLRGRMLYLHRSDVPVAEGDMLIADMIGLPVLHAESGEALGSLSDVSDRTGRRLYTVKCPDGREVLVPGVPEFIKEISESGVRIMPIPGLFEGGYEI